MSTVAELSAEINASLSEKHEASAHASVHAGDLATGMYPDMPMDEYLALPFMSAGKLEKLRRSPLQYQHSLIAPRESTSALERGTALHLAILEPELFEEHYVVLGQCEGVTGKKERCRYNASFLRDGRHFCGTHDPLRSLPMDEGVEIISGLDYAKVLGMRDAVMNHERARSLFEGKGAFECTIVFDDPETGIRCKIRPDRLVERTRMYVAVKTARDASAWAFARDAEKRGYFRGLALYRRGLRAIGWPPQEIAVLAIEPEAPHDLNPFLTEPEDIDSADAEVTRLLLLYHTCTENDYWPGYASSESGFSILRRPEWAKKGQEHDGDS